MQLALLSALRRVYPSSADAVMTDGATPTKAPAKVEERKNLFDQPVFHGFGRLDDILCFIGRMTLNRYLLSSFWVCLGHYLATFFLHIDGPMRSSSTAQAVFTMSLWLISCWVFVFVFYLLDLNRAEGKLPWFIARFKLAAATTVVPGYIKLPATTLYSFGQMAYVTLRNELLAYVLCVALWIKFDLCVAPSPLHILLSQRLGLPPLLESFVANAVYFVFYDTVFYIGHRLMHMKQFNLYAITHELHHLSFADAGVSHHFMGIIDFFLEVIIPVAVPVLVCGFHAPTLSSFVVMGAWNGVVVHSGWDFPFCPNPCMHIAHHHKYRVNFSLGLLDSVFDTVNDGAYIELPVAAAATAALYAQQQQQQQQQQQKEQAPTKSSASSQAADKAAAAQRGGGGGGNEGSGGSSAGGGEGDDGDGGDGGSSGKTAQRRRV